MQGRSNAVTTFATGCQGHWLFGLPELAWMWVMPVSTLVTVGAAALVSMVFGEESGKLS